MGQYKIALYFEEQIGIMIKYKKGCFFQIDLPFIKIYFGLLDCAEGIRFFKD